MAPQPGLAALPHQPLRHPSLVPFQLFQGSDGQWFLVGCAKEKFFDRVAETVGRPELADHPDYATFADRGEHRDALIAILDELFAEQPAEYWIARLKEVGVPTGPVQDVPAALKHPHTVARKLLVETPNEVLGPVSTVASPVRVGDPDDVSYARAPHRDEHADEILGSLLGYDDGTIRSLGDSGAFG